MANPEQSRQLAAQNLNPDEILKADADSPMDSGWWYRVFGYCCCCWQLSHRVAVAAIITLSPKMKSNAANTANQTNSSEMRPSTPILMCTRLVLGGKRIYI